MKPTASRYIPWLLGAAVSAASLVVWSSGLGVTGLTAYSLFPLFGLLAWSLMWTHYIYGVLMVRYGYDRSVSYKRVSELVVFACLWLHPGILIYQLWIDKHLLPPGSIADYLGKANTIFILGAFIAWLTFLSYDVLIRFKNKPFWQRNWFWVSLSQAAAMGIIYLHAIKFGRHIQVTWFKGYWLLLGLILVPSVMYLLWNELPESWKLKTIMRRVMKNTKLIVALGVIGLIMVGGIAYIGMSREKDSTATTPPVSTGSSSSATTASSAGITLAEVQKNNGKNGAKCWVIVDTTVYEISGFAQWVDGVHTPSGGQARCGKDLTDVIDQAPHGRSVLRLLTNVGTYQP